MCPLIASDLPRQVISFLLNDQEFALDLRVMQEVVLLPTINPLPQTQDYLLGVINLRGRIVALIDLRRRLGKPSADFTLKTAVLICRLNGECWGLVVDEVADIMDIPVDAWVHLPEKLEEGQQGGVIGIAKMENRLVFILNSRALLEDLSGPSAALVIADHPLTAQAIPTWEDSPRNLLTGGGTSTPPRSGGA